MPKEQAKTCQTVSLRQAAGFLKRHDNFVILTHASPDGDTLGAAYALYYGLRKIGKTASVICPDVIPKKYDYFACRTDHVDKDRATVLAVDVADRRLLGALEETFGDAVALCIDHHISNTGYAKALCLDASASATCEIIFSLLRCMHIPLDTEMAKALYTGLATDTGCFKYSNVTANTHRIAAELYRFSMDAAQINRLMFDTKSRRLLELERMVLDTAEYHFDGRCILLTVTAQMQEKTGCVGSELEGIAVISRSVEGVVAGVTVKQTDENEYKISLRTYPPLDASQICRQLGGGGHKGAAGATLTGSLDEVKAAVLQAVGSVMEETNAGTSSAE